MSDFLWALQSGLDCCKVELLSLPGASSAMGLLPAI
jgi:NADH:ubiquinone oxidoreductase subunit B-like Fe-S oxidoreductase